MARAILLTDLDNTLFNWVDFFGSSLRAMVHALSKSLSVEEELLYDELKREYSSHGTLEFRYVIQHLPSFTEAPPDRQEKALHAAVVAFGGSRRKQLAVYEGVLDLLDWLNHQGVTVVAVTNAPALETLGRLRTLGLSKRLSGLVAWEGPAPVRELLHQRISTSPLKWVRVLQQEFLKPHPRAYADAIEACGGCNRDRIWVIGDSLEKDLRPAKEIGARTVWAKYGREFSKKNFDTLLKVTHWSEERVASTYALDHFEPDFVVQTPLELREIIPALQGGLFD